MRIYLFWLVILRKRRRRKREEEEKKNYKLKWIDKQASNVMENGLTSGLGFQPSVPFWRKSKRILGSWGLDKRKRGRKLQSIDPPWHRPLECYKSIIRRSQPETRSKTKIVQQNVCDTRTNNTHRPTHIIFMSLLGIMWRWQVKRDAIS